MESVLSGGAFIALYGVSYGFVLFTIAIGLVVTMGLMRVINLAHGAFAAIGGYLTIALMHSACPIFPRSLCAVGARRRIGSRRSSARSSFISTARPTSIRC